MRRRRWLGEAEGEGEGEGHRGLLAGRAYADGGSLSAWTPNSDQLMGYPHLPSPLPPRPRPPPLTSPPTPPLPRWGPTPGCTMSTHASTARCTIGSIAIVSIASGRMAMVSVAIGSMTHASTAKCAASPRLPLECCLLL